MTPQILSILDPAGAPQLLGTMAGGKLQDTLRIYDNGLPQASIQYKDGLPHGPCLLLHAAHQPSAKLFYRAGKLHGQAEFYSSEGQLVRKTGYQMGLLHGLQQDFYPDGTLFEQASYRNGLLDGIWQRYHHNGILSERRNYSLGRQSTFPECFNERGHALPNKAMQVPRS